jgi:hypothetical protein
VDCDGNRRIAAPLNGSTFVWQVMSSEVETSLVVSRIPFRDSSTPLGMTKRAKKTGRKIYSPPGLKFGVVTPKKFGAVNPALGLVPLFLR